MASDRDQLLSMGFDAARVEWALKATNNRGLQPAMDFLLENSDKDIPDLSTVTASAGAGAGGTGGGGWDVSMGEDEDEDAAALRAAIAKSSGVSEAAVAGGSNMEGVEAKSIKCSQCGKIFKNTAMAEFHAEKSGHDQFEESLDEVKPLTEEEKKQKLAELREKMGEKRALKAKQDAEDSKANEALRRKAGQDMTQVREELKLKEAKKEAEAKKREKIEEAKAKAAVKAQIEADKKARHEKAAREKALRDAGPGGIPMEPAVAAGPSSAATTPAAAGGPKKEYKEARLQIRLSAGGTYTTTIPAEGSLQDVAEFLAAQTMAVSVETVTFASHFPRKTFTRDEWKKTLKDLGLVPSAVLIAS